MKKIIASALMLTLPFLVEAQNTFPANGSVGIGTTTPSAEAILEISSTTQGVYFPRMTQAQRNAIVNPQLGLIIFQTNGARGLYFYNGSVWAQVTKNAWQLVGNSGLNMTDHFIGTKDNMGVAFRTNNIERMRMTDAGRIGIGTSSPLFTLHVESSTELRSGYFYNTTNSAAPTFGLYAGAFGTGAGDKRGGSFDASGGTGINIGVRGFASGGSQNFGGYFIGDGYFSNNLGVGTASPSSRISVSGDAASTASVVDVVTNYVGSVDIRGVNSVSTPADGYGYGVYGTGGYMGVRGTATAGAYTGSAYGVYGFATGTAGTRFGVYGTASGGSENWGGYFPTKSYTSELRVGNTIGATGYILCVDGKAIAEEVRVELSGSWPDYVFEENYDLRSIADLKEFVNTNKHLPGMPSAAEVEDKGHHLGEVQQKLLEKIEEMTLYIFELESRIKALESK
ncbi:MAG TPA: hypothetical protein PKH65_08025 [Bacteroidia bacterium]|nr:hypothetical protein [Bacteroidia bacterium]HNT80613.1 hypothetical protein [Bacteroidia bacterium]